MISSAVDLDARHETEGLIADKSVAMPPDYLVGIPRCRFATHLKLLPRWYVIPL